MRCLGCPAFGSRVNTPDGTGRLGVAIVADSLTKNDGKGVLTGRAGAMLGRALSRYGWKAEDFWLFSTAFCEPAPKFEAQACRTCTHFDVHMRAVQSKVFVSAGRRAFTRLTGLDIPPLQTRGYVFPALNGGWVVATLPPGFWMSKPDWMTAVLSDVAKAVRIAAEGNFAYDSTIVPVCNPSISWWDDYVRRFLENPLQVLAADIETPYKKRADQSPEELAGEDFTMTRIDEVNFSTDGLTGVSVDFNDTYRLGIEAMLKASQEHGTSIFWNASYDVPRLEKHTSVRFDVRHLRDPLDAMRVWRNNIPRKDLGNASSLLPSCWNVKAWKWLGTSDPFYRAMDVIALYRADCDLIQLLEAEGQMRAYDLFVRRLDPHLTRMTDTGLLTDAAKVEALSAEVGQRLLAEQAAMTALVLPDQLPTKVWQTRKAAEKGLGLLQVAGEVLPGVELTEIPATREVQGCGQCGEAPVTMAHITRKTIPLDNQIAC